MHLSITELVTVLDRIGIVAFAFSGVEVGARKRLDVFGLLVMGAVTATGGGLMRDVVIQRVPFVLAHADYMFWAIGSSCVAILLVMSHKRIPPPLLLAADAAGLGAFAAAGAVAGIHAELPLPAIVLLAILTGTGGGVLRDLLANRVPLVLHSEVNATAAALGGLATWAIEPWSVNGAAAAGLCITGGIRLVTAVFRLNLPRARSTPGEGEPEL